MIFSLSLTVNPFATSVSNNSCESHSKESSEKILPVATNIFEQLQQTWGNAAAGIPNKVDVKEFLDALQALGVNTKKQSVARLINFLANHNRYEEIFSFIKKIGDDPLRWHAAQIALDWLYLSPHGQQSYLKAIQFGVKNGMNPADISLQFQYAKPTCDDVLYLIYHGDETRIIQDLKTHVLQCISKIACKRKKQASQEIALRKKTLETNLSLFPKELMSLTMAYEGPDQIPQYCEKLEKEFETFCDQLTSKGVEAVVSFASSVPVGSPERESLLYYAAMKFLKDQQVLKAIKVLMQMEENLRNELIESEILTFSVPSNIPEDLSRLELLINEGLDPNTAFKLYVSRRALTFELVVFFIYNDADLGKELEKFQLQPKSVAYYKQHNDARIDAAYKRRSDVKDLIHKNKIQFSTPVDRITYIYTLCSAIQKQAEKERVSHD